MKCTPFNEAVDILVERVKPVGTGTVGIDDLCGRILAEDIISGENVPSFARSPYDGYAFRSADTSCIGTGTDKVTLKLIDNIRAGQVSKKTVTEGTAIRLMTGSSVPEGADCVCKYEDTDFTEEEVVIKRSYRSGDNIVTAGEDIRKGSVVARRGSYADPGIIGVLSSLGVREARVYKRIRAGIITTGDEICDISDPPAPGMIRDSNRYMISAALEKYNTRVRFLGHASDKVANIRKLIEAGLAKCNVIISTGGVSVGDYDLVPKVMEDMGFEILVRSVAIKPGMACVYGIKDGILMLALSGNPASALTNLQCVCAPALRKMSGLERYGHDIIDMNMDCGFENKGGNLRLVRGRMNIRDGRAVFEYPKSQGNVVISSAADTNAYALVGPGTNVLERESVRGFLI